MTPSVRKVLLTAHISSSVAWLGAVLAFLALAIAGLSSPDSQMVRAAYLTMNLLARFVIAPLAFAALLTGIIQSLSTEWGLLRHYWVLAKLLLTLFSTVILLLKLELIGRIAGVAATSALSATDLRDGRIELLVHAGGGLLVLFTIATLSVFKPWGRTRYGVGKQRERYGETKSAISPSIVTMPGHGEPVTTPLDMKFTTPIPANKKMVNPLQKRLKIILAVIGVIVVGFLAAHLVSGALGRHSH